MFTYELQRRHPELTVLAVHAGMVRTGLGGTFPRVGRRHAASYDGAAVSRLWAATELLRGPFGQ